MSEAGFAGVAPAVFVTPINGERAKYEQLWDRATYREVSPGEIWAMTFLQQARVEADAEVIDFGCGTGRGGLALALFGAMKVRMLDFAANCLDEEVVDACAKQPERIRFDLADLTLPIQWNAAYGYCCDVMEHIPTVDVPTVLSNILSSAQHVFFGISTVDDQLGSLIGERLHLTVQPLAWWLTQLRAAGALVHWSAETEGACAVYCTAWKAAADVLPEGRVNTDEALIDSQVQENIKAGWAHAMPHDAQDREVMILAGGPSLAGQLDEIRRLRAEGAALITVNGAYGWAIENGLSPSAQIVLDAREFNSRFVLPLVDSCRYLIASQVHPKTLEALPRDRTLLWHSGVTEAAEALVRERTGHFFPIPGGSTVVLRAIALLRMLGFRQQHLFGFDSCLSQSNHAHHAYPQPENDGEPVIPVSVGGRAFECTPWMLHQANEFMELVKCMGDEVEIAVHGDGLIAHIVNTGAAISTEA